MMLARRRGGRISVSMNALTSSLVVAGIVFIGAMVGFFASRLLPETHMTRETQDVVRLGTGMLSVLASLVLGLLIATAKGASDNTVQSLRGYAADLPEGATEELNLALTAHLIAESALMREESRGGHYRADFPLPRGAWASRHVSFGAVAGGSPS